MTYADRIPAPRPVPTTRHRLDDARSHALEVERDDLRIQVGRADADNRAMMRDRDQALAERDAARNDAKQAAQLATFRQGVIDRHRQELGAAGDVLAVVRDAVERIDRALAVYDTTSGETCSPPCTLPKGHPWECDANQQPHEDPARLRGQLAEAHADCARYATERDEALAERDNAKAVVESAKLWRWWHGNTNAAYADACQALEAAVDALGEPQSPALGSPSPRAQDEPGRRSETGCMGDPDTELRLAGVHPDQEAARRQGYADAIAALRDDSRYMAWWSPTGLKPAGTVRQHLAAYLETVGPDGPDVTKPMPEREG